MMTTHSARDYNRFRSTFRVEDLTARFAGYLTVLWVKGSVCERERPYMRTEVRIFSKTI
jgi:hypothetical protein